MNDPGSVLLQYGVAGVAMLVEGWVIARLYGDNKQLQKEKDALQEARRVDAQENMQKMVQPLSGISQTINLIYDKLQASKGARE